MTQSFEKQVEELRTRGYTVIENFIDQSIVNEAIVALDQVFDKESGSATRLDTKSHLVSHVMVEKAPVFRKICQNPKILSFVRHLLGQDCLLSSYNGFTTKPLGEEQTLHQDSLGAKGCVLAVNALHALDEFTTVNGCVRLVPFSQDTEENLREPEYAHLLAVFEKQAIPIETPPGSLIVYNGSIVHGSGRNTTAKRRRALHIFFTRSFIAQQWDIPRSLSPQTINDLTEDEKRLYGFYARPTVYDYKTGELLFNYLEKPVGSQ